MKSFDILIDGRLIQSDLIVVNLPIRNDIAAYYWLNLDSEITNPIIAEKAMLFSDNASSIALYAGADSSVTKYDIVEARPIVLNASAEFKSIYLAGLCGNTIEIQQGLQEVSQKIERISLPISIGANDMLAIMPLKTVGSVENAINFNVFASEIKNSFVDSDGIRNGIELLSSLDNPFATYYEQADAGVNLCAYIKSLSYLLHMRVIQSGTRINSDLIDIDKYRSSGRISARIAIDAKVPFSVEFFVDAESSINLLSEAEVSAFKLLNTESSISLVCDGHAVLRRTRTLAEIDAFGMLSDIDDMTLEDMYYVDIGE